MSKIPLRRTKHPQDLQSPDVRRQRARPMRDLIFVGYIALIMLMAFKRPFLFTLVYAYVDIVSPQRLGYFLLNLFMLTMSTVMVFRGRIQPMEQLRFLIAFRLPWQIPQLLEFGAFPAWAVHLSFRIYSMMLTTTVLGLAIGWFYKPRSWCTVCPINTLSDVALTRMTRKH